MSFYEEVGIHIPTVYLPDSSVDPTRWACIACDQFTSQPEYWQQVEAFIGDSPSTYHLILPEYLLGTSHEEARIASIHAAMQRYLAQGILTPHRGLVYLERTFAGRVRKGLLVALDLEKYDFRRGAKSLIRATEETIIERLPPRIKIRQGAPLELPHILVLIDDPAHTVIEPLAGQKDRLLSLYNTDLMLGSGHVAGWQIKDLAIEQQVIRALQQLIEPQNISARVGLPPDEPPLLYAMGDGNHSLATAKAIWEQIKPTVGLHHPARYALVELENVHDPAISFEPIHRVLFGIQRDLPAYLSDYYEGAVSFQPAGSVAELVQTIDHPSPTRQQVGYLSAETMGIITFHKPSSNLPVGTLQQPLDAYLKAGCASKMDYVHGQDILTSLASEVGNAGFYLPGMAKSDLFPTVIKDGALPRKTFSMGEAREKRFYYECRKIIP